MYAIDATYYVSRSDDEGATWTNIDIGKPLYKSISSIVINNATILIGTDVGVYRSTDNGSSWSTANSGFPEYSDPKISYLVASGPIAIATIYGGGGVYLSSNNGAAWTPIADMPMIEMVYSLASFGNRLFIGTNSGVYYSTDNGTHWKVADTNLSNIEVLTLIVNGDSFFAGTNLGVFVSKDSGFNWIPTNSGLTNLTVNSLAANASIILAGTENALFYYNLKSQNWFPVSSSITNSSLIRPYNVSGILSRSLLANNSNLFAAIWGNVYQSDDNGLNWAISDSGLKNVGTPSAIINCGENILLATYLNHMGIGGGSYSGNIFLSADNGKTWSSVLSNSSAALNLFALGNSKIFAIATSFYHMGPNVSTIYLSTNNGITWASVDTLQDHIISFACNGNVLFAGTMNHGVLISLNDGKTWFSANSGFPDTTISINSVALNNGDVFVGTSQGVFFSKDNGSTWFDLNEGLNVSNITSIIVNDNYLYVGTIGNGVWKKPIADVGINNFQKNDRLTKTSCFNVTVPTHSHNSLAITFPLLSTKNISITLYNLAGFKVSTIYNGYLETGLHSLTYNTSYVAAGYYIVKMQAGPNRYVKSIMIPR